MHARSILLFAALACAPLALAHHGWSEYDASRTLNISGKILEPGYEHPHGHIRLEADGKVWNVVLAPPSRMQARGLPRAALNPGATATVVGYPNRNKPDEMRAERITVDDKTVELR
jgi:DNA-binding transcriptional regulator of glucitol operon